MTKSAGTIQDARGDDINIEGNDRIYDAVNRANPEFIIKDITCSK